MAPAAIVDQPTVAVLCDPAAGLVAACAVALALGVAAGTRRAVAMAVGHGERPALPLTAASGRGAAYLRERGYDAAAVGRLVWLADLRVARRAHVDGRAPLGPHDDDPVGVVAAASVELSGAARAVGAPGAVAIPLARTAALDRVLGWHDGIVVVEDERTTMPELAELARESLATLDRPVTAMALPSRLPARAAVAGLRASEAALRAVAELGLASVQR